MQEEAQRNASVVYKERVIEVSGEEAGSVGRASPVVEALIAAKAGGCSNRLHWQWENRMSSSFLPYPK